MGGGISYLLLAPGTYISLEGRFEGEAFTALPWAALPARRPSLGGGVRLRSLPLSPFELAGLGAVSPLALPAFSDANLLLRIILALAGSHSLLSELRPRVS